MKHLTVAISIFLLTMVSGNITFAHSSTSNRAVKEAKCPAPAEVEYTYVRVCIAGAWWTYVYLDGSFIVAIPDIDE